MLLRNKLQELCYHKPTSGVKRFSACVTLGVMNSGTQWTRRRSSNARSQLTAQPAKHKMPPKSPRTPLDSRLVFRLTVAGIVCIGSLVSYAIIHRANTAQAPIIAQAKKRAEQASGLLDATKARRATETAYAHYAAGAVAQSIKSGVHVIPKTSIQITYDHLNPSRLDSIVNKQHPIYPLDYEPATVAANCQGSSAKATVLAAAKDDLEALCRAAAAVGVSLHITSSYRTYADQVATYNWWIAYSGKSTADTHSARPGYSEHQLGLSIDFSAGDLALDDFTGTAQQEWLAKNAYKYGWIQRYTSENSSITGFSAESWHYRYVGRDAARRYIESGARSLEDFWNISGGTYDKRVAPR